MGLSMKNNKGFTLVGLLGIMAVISALTMAGMMINKYMSNRSQANFEAAQTSAIKKNIEGQPLNAGSIESSAGQSMPGSSGDLPTTGAPGNINNAYDQANPDPYHPDNPGNPNNSDSPMNPSGSENIETKCNLPCHTAANPKTGATTCMLTDADCICLGICPIPVAPCVYVAKGPLNPKYVPTSQGGQGQACPGNPKNCVSPYIPCPNHGGECHCPFDHSDCIPWGSPPPSGMTPPPSAS